MLEEVHLWLQPVLAVRVAVEVPPEARASKEAAEAFAHGRVPRGLRAILKYGAEILLIGQDGTSGWMDAKDYMAPVAHVRGKSMDLTFR